MVWVLEKVYDCDSAEVLAVYNKFDLQDATIEAKKDLGVQVKEEIMSWKEIYSNRGFKDMKLAEAEVLGPLRLYGMECDESLCEDCKGILMGLNFEDELFYDKKCEADFDPDDEDYSDSPPEEWFDFVHYDDDKNNQYFFSIGLLNLHLQYYRYYESGKLKIKEV